MLRYSTDNYKFIGKVYENKNFYVSRIVLYLYESPRGAKLANAYIFKYSPHEQHRGVHVCSLYIPVKGAEPKIFYEKVASSAGFSITLEDSKLINEIFDKLIKWYNDGEYIEKNRKGNRIIL